MLFAFVCVVCLLVLVCGVFKLFCCVMLHGSVSSLVVCCVCVCDCVVVNACDFV